MDDDLDVFFQGLDTASCEAGGVSFEALYDEAFFDDAIGGAVFGENAPAITTQARFVRGLKRGDAVSVALWCGRVVFRAADEPREDGTGIAVVPLVR